MAKFYDASMRKIEEACLSTWRAELLSVTSGDVLEIGGGTGVNLIYYPKSVSHLVLTEPDSHMLALLRRNLAENYDGPASAENLFAENLSYADNSFDSVVSTLVLCSVDSPDATLREIKRVLKPKGKIYFIEHVLATDAPHLIKWQKFFQPVWICMCGNCHLTRNTEKSISDAGFTFEKIEKLYSTGGPAIVSPTIKGVAINICT